jgi:SagB-type dehydrogenase family enzyme
LPSVELPPADYPSTGIAEAMAGRRSRRSFGESAIGLVQLSTLLHAAYGVTDTSDTNGGQPFRNVPSGGGLYPLDVYPVVRNVEDVPAGLYHYEPLRGVLELIRDQDIDEALREILLVAPGMPDFTNSCGLVFFVVGTFWRTRFKYALRGYRFTLIEAGHLGQNLLLTAESLGINAFANGGYWDHRVDSFLGVDGVNESVIYSVVAGSAPTESGP